MTLPPEPWCFVGEPDYPKENDMPFEASHGKMRRGLTVNDAPNRSWRTILQGAAVVAVIALATALLEWLQAGEFSLRTLGISAITAVLMAILAYLHRTVLDPSGFPSALPPSDPGPPAEPDPGIQHGV